MTAGEYTLILDPDHPLIRIAETESHFTIERPDFGELVQIPKVSFEMFVQMLSEWLEPDEPDDDGDDDEIGGVDGEGYDGGFGPGSYFNRAMNKDD